MAGNQLKTHYFFKIVCGALLNLHYSSIIMGSMIDELLLKVKLIRWNKIFEMLPSVTVKVCVFSPLIKQSVYETAIIHLELLFYCVH